MPKHKVSTEAIRSWPDNSTNRAPAIAYLAVTFKDNQSANIDLDSITTDLPTNSSALLFGDSIIITLRDANANATALLRELKGHSTNAFLSTNCELSITLNCFAPSADASTNLMNELNECFASGLTNLIPPWNSAAAGLDFSRYDAARKEWEKISGKLAKAGSTIYKQRQKASIAALNSHNTNDIDRFFKEEKAEADRARDTVYQELKTEYAGTPNASLLENEHEWLYGSFTNSALRAETASKLAEQLGVYQNSPAPWVTSGSAWSTGMQLRSSFAIRDPEKTLPQLIEWLTAKKCTRLQYDLTGYDRDDFD